MDEGWTRFLFDQYRIPYRSLADADIQKGNLRAEFDVIVLPDMSPQEIVNGPRSGSMPPEYMGGLGDSGHVRDQGVRRSRAARSCASTRRDSSPSTR